MSKKQTTTLIPNEKLKQERLLRGWTQADLAGFLGTDGYTVNRWERGRAHPSPYFRQKLCELFGKNTLELGLMPLQAEEAGVATPHATEDNPLFWSLPHPPNPCFTGREEILQHLHQLLSNEQPIALTQAPALSGLGGIGKTQVAIEYAYRYAQEYSAVFWLAAETTESLIMSVQEIAEQLQLPEREAEEQAQLITAVQRWLATHSGWLLIGDNMEDFDLFQMLLPARRQGALLLTTRRQTSGPLVKSLELPPMSHEESITLLLRRAGQLQLASAQSSEAPEAQPAPVAESTTLELVAFLEGLPLALDQAGAYIEETGCSIADYLERCRHQRKQVLARRGAYGGSHPASVVTTLKLAVEKIARAHPAAAELLYACAFLHPDGIPEELFASEAARQETTLGQLASEPYKFDLALAALRSASLVKRYPETRTLAIHRLVQAVLQDQMDQDEARLWSKRVICMVNAVFPPNGEFDTWPQCERYLAQAFACVPLIEQVGRELVEASALLTKMGSYLMERGRLKEAEPILEQMYTLSQQQPDLDQLMFATRLMEYAELFWRQGKYEAAEPLLQQVLSIREKALGPDHDEVATALNNLALLYWQLGKYDLAEPLFQRALRIHEEHLGPDHPDTCMTLSNLGLLYWKQGRYELAEPLYQRVLQSEEKRRGPDHPEITDELNSLGHLYMDQQKYELAEPLFQRALQIREEHAGSEHPDTMIVLNNLANLYLGQGKLDQAEPLYQHALSVREKQLDPENPFLAQTLLGLATLYREQQDYEQAELLFQRVLAIQEKRLGPEHLDLGRTLHRLAILYERQGKDEQAEDLLTRALAIRERRMTPNHPELVENRADLARISAKLSKTTFIHYSQI